MTPFSVLLIDDDGAFSTALARALQRHAYDVRTAANSTEAFDQLKKWNPQGVLLDLRLGSENGLQLLHDLRQVLPHARIVMLTGYGSIATAVEAIKRGADNYLVKPASLAELIAALAPDDMLVDVEPAFSEPANEPLNLRQQSWEHIQRVLAEHDGNISAAARALGMHRRTLQRRLMKAPRPR